MFMPKCKEKMQSYYFLEGRKLGNKYSTLCKNLPNEELHLVLLTMVNVRIIMRENCLAKYKTGED